MNKFYLKNRVYIQLFVTLISIFIFYNIVTSSADSIQSSDNNNPISEKIEGELLEEKKEEFYPFPIIKLKNSNKLFKLIVGDNLVSKTATWASLLMLSESRLVNIFRT